MKAPCQGRGVRKCCCCVLDPDYVCYLIGALCIAFVAFGGLSFGVSAWVDVLIAVIGFFYYTVAGLCLIIGTLYMNKSAKILYCWMMFFGIILIIFAIIFSGVTIIYGKGQFYLFPDKDESLIIAIYVVFALKSVFLIFFSIYTPLLVLGNLDTCRVPPNTAKPSSS